MTENRTEYRGDTAISHNKTRRVSGFSEVKGHISGTRREPGTESPRC